jgi:murein DD-endopeptidase MepM/ murein hydrolase activator NlpD
MSTKKEKRKLVDRLRNKYRLVVMNEDTFEERFSLRQTPLGFLWLSASFMLVIIFLVVILIAFTPIREYIPGYADVGVQNQLIKLNFQADSLQKSVVFKQRYLDNIALILSGKDSAIQPKDLRDSTKNYGNMNFQTNAADSALRNEIENQDQYSLTIDVKPRGGVSGFFFFVPIKGEVSSAFDLREENFGVDILSADENEPVRSTLDGTVIASGWSTAYGYVISVQHAENLISIYKYNSVALKKPGESVRAGDPIAIVGSFGKQGPQLHFELWYNGTAINPTDYMVFQ